MKPDQDPPTSGTPFANSYWVVPGRFLAGEYPGDREPQLARRKLTNMLQTGINMYIDLTHPSNGLESYHKILKEEASDLGVDIEIYVHPVADFDIPAPLEMKAILDQIDQALLDEKIVYVHCWGGIGRTGTVVGCYLVRHGLDGESALRQLKELRKSTPKHWLDAPESPEQVKMVLEWRTGG